MQLIEKKKLTLDSKYAEQLQARICKPIGLRRTSYMTPADVDANVAISFWPSGKTWMSLIRPIRAFGHNGGIDGFQSSLGHFEDEDVTVAMIGNGVNCSMNEIMLGVLSIVFDEPYEMPSSTDVDVPEEVIRKDVGTYVKKDFPLKLSITVGEGQLVAQGSGQPSFFLAAKSKSEFRSDAFGVVIIFAKSDPDGPFDTLRLKQGGQDLQFQKE